MSRRFAKGTQRLNHKEPLVTMKSLLQERPRHDSGFVQQQLRFDAMNPWRLLQSLNHVHEQPRLNLLWVWQSCAVRHEQIPNRSEEHTSELQSQSNLVCRLLLEKKQKT